VLIPSNPPAPPDQAPLTLRAHVLRFAYTGRRKFATTAALALVLMLGYHVVFGDNGLTTYQSKRHESADLARQIEALQVENAKLNTHDQLLKKDPNAITDAIHGRIHYVKPDEVIVTVAAAPATTPGPASARAPAK
jgi:cell division protein FtsB